MQNRRLRLLRLGAGGILLVVATLVSLFWPGPLALDDRIPLVLLFGIPAALVADSVRRGRE